MLCKILHRVAAAEVPAPVLPALRTCELVALPKKKGGVRPILLSPMLRRYSLKGVVATVKQNVQPEVGSFQLGVGTLGGAEGALLSIKFAATTAPNAVAIALNCKAAFQHASRKQAYETTATWL